MNDSPVALITGGGSGIGAATARQLVEQGYRVTITGRSEDRLRRFAAELGEPDGLLVVPGSAADHTAVRTAVATTVTTFGRLDVVVANAGHATFDDLADGDPTHWDDMVLTNVLGPALLINAALPALRGSCSSAVWPATSTRQETSTAQRNGPSPASRRTPGGW